jgi:hypothetical protein
MKMRKSALAFAAVATVFAGQALAADWPNGSYSEYVQAGNTGTYADYAKGANTVASGERAFGYSGDVSKLSKGDYFPATGK